MSRRPRALAAVASAAVVLVVAWFVLQRIAGPPQAPSARSVQFEPLAARSLAPAPPLILRDVAPEGAESREPPRPPQGVLPDRYPPSVLVQSISRRFEPVRLSDRSTVHTAVASPLDTPRSDRVAEAVQYSPGCIGYAKRLWAAGETRPADSARPVLGRRNCLRGPPTEIVLEEPSIRGGCGTPDRDRGLPAMCAQRRR